MKVLACLLFFFALQATAAEPLRFAPLPVRDGETLLRETLPLLRWLEQRTGRALIIVQPADHQQLVAGFIRGDIDLAVLGPLPYVMLRERFAAAEPLVHWLEVDGQPHYRCALVSFAGDDIALSALRRQRIALTQPLSTCGPLLTDALLRREAGFGLGATRAEFLGGHDSVALGVIAGEFAAGGMRESIAHEYAHLGLRIDALSAPVPGFALVANSERVDAALLNVLREVLGAASATDRQHWGPTYRHGARPASDAGYEHIRRLIADAPPEVRP